MTGTLQRDETMMLIHGYTLAFGSQVESTNNYYLQTLALSSKTAFPERHIGPHSVCGVDYPTPQCSELSAHSSRLQQTV